MESLSFNISASQAHKIDPQNLLLFDVSFIAYSSRDSNNVGVYVGMLTQPVEGVIASNASYSPTHASTASGLISYTLGLIGACLTLDTACSTQLVGAHLARAEIQRGYCGDAMAICVNVLGAAWNAGFAGAGMTSPKGRCHSFDGRGDGYARAEGCLALFLSEEREITEIQPKRPVLATAV